MIKNNKNENIKDNGAKKTIIIMSVTAGLIIILIILFVYPNIVSKLTDNSNDITPASDFTFPSASDKRIYSDITFNSDFDSYSYGLSIDQILDICGAPNKKLSQALVYNYVYFDTYLSDMTFLFEDDKLYGCLYDILNDVNKTYITIEDYYSIKEYFIAKYGVPIKTNDGKNSLERTENMYSRWENDTSFIKIEIINNDGTLNITIGYIEKSKADN